MLNFIYYPVSGILWFWHKVFGFLLGPSNGFAWALSVIFLTFTLRALLIKPFISQVRSMRKMQEFQPQIKKLQEKYKNDKQKLAEEMQKLQKEHGVNPLGGCLPVFVQLPVFIGLFHVLRGFQPSYPYNYVFSRADIQSFLDADILGVRLSDSIAGGQAALGQISFSAMQFNAAAIAVCLPLMIVSSVATHFTARVSQQHQSAAASANPQAAMMGRITMWVFPIGILIFGALFPVAILLYWLSNNTWTLAQQYLVYKKIAAEEAAARQEAREHRDTLAPKVGQKPTRPDRRDVSTDDVATAAAVADEPSDEPQDASAVPASGRTSGTEDSAPGAPGGSRGSGKRSPGKVGGGQKNGQPKNGQQKNGQAQSGQGSGGQGSGGQSKGGKKKGQLASSGRPGKRKK